MARKSLPSICPSVKMRSLSAMSMLFPRLATDGRARKSWNVRFPNTTSRTFRFAVTPWWKRLLKQVKSSWKDIWAANPSPKRRSEPPCVPILMTELLFPCPWAPIFWDRVFIPCLTISLNISPARRDGNMPVSIWKQRKFFRRISILQRRRALLSSRL